MSHFSVLAVIPDKVMEKEEMYIREFIEINMSKYDENKIVKGYKTECSCHKLIVRNKATTETIKKVGDIDSFRESFKKIEKEIKKKYSIPEESSKEWDEWIKNQKNEESYEESEKEINTAWKLHIKPYTDLEQEFTKKYLPKTKPDSRCSDCRGKGWYMSTYNPYSKWDWYRVGGRWDGILTDSPQTSEKGFNFDDKHETIKNNGIKVKELLKKIESKNEKDRKKYLTYAILNKDGEWIGRGKMGWWGMSSGDKDNWDEIFMNILKKADQDDWGVILDCHI